MRTTIVVCLLFTLCGLATGRTVKREVNLTPNKFDETKALQETKVKMQELLVKNVLNWREAHLFLSITRKNAHDNFNVKLKEEFNIIQTAVDIAKKKGKDAKHCLTTTKNKLTELQQIITTKFAQCIDINMKEFEKSFNISAKVRGAGDKAIEEIKGVRSGCILSVYHKEECIAAGRERARDRVASFYEKLELHRTYRRVVFDEMVDSFVDCITAHVIKLMDKLQATKLISQICIDDA